MENRKMIFVQCGHIGKRDKATPISPSSPFGRLWSKIEDWFNNRRVKDMHIQAVLVKVWSPLPHCLSLSGLPAHTVRGSDKNCSHSGRAFLSLGCLHLCWPPEQQHNEGVLCLQPRMSALCVSEVGFCEKLDNLRNKKLPVFQKNQKVFQPTSI